MTVGAGGSLSFASFTAGEGLQPKSVLIDAPMDGNVLKFNETLTYEQRNFFRWKDATDETRLMRVDQDENGYLHPHDHGASITIF